MVGLVVYTVFTDNAKRAGNGGVNDRLPHLLVLLRPFARNRASARNRAKPIPIVAMGAAANVFKASALFLGFFGLQFLLVPDFLMSENFLPGSYSLDKWRHVGGLHQSGTEDQVP